MRLDLRHIRLELFYGFFGCWAAESNSYKNLTIYLLIYAFYCLYGRNFFKYLFSFLLGFLQSLCLTILKCNTLPNIGSMKPILEEYFPIHLRETSALNASTATTDVEFRWTPYSFLVCCCMVNGLSMRCVEWSKRWFFELMCDCHNGE